MALDLTVLEKGVLRLLQKKPSTPLEWGSRLGKLYEQYAKGGRAAGAPPSFTGKEKDVMAGVLAAAFESKVPVPGLPFGPALLAFWMTPPVSFGVGVTLLVPGAVAVVAVVTAIPPGLPDHVCARLLATALDVATRTVLVQVGPNLVLLV